jgi:hypothetical protein
MDYEVTKLLLFKALTEPKKDMREPIGTLSTIQLNEFSRSEIFYSILLMQNQIKFVKELNINRSLKFKKFLKRINKKKKDLIKQKTLFLDKNQLKGRVDNIAKIKRRYDYDVEIKSQEVIEEAIVKNNSDVVYARFLRLRSLHFLIIINAENGEMLFGKVSTGFFQNKIGPRFLRKMNK